MRTPIQDLAEQQLRLNETAAYIVPLVLQCRLAGYSWVQIGRAMGVSKQAAQRRFSKYVIDPRQSPGHGA